MTQRSLSRRLVVGGTSAALLAGVVGFIPLLGSASAAACPSWSDPAGDSAATLDPLGSDPSGFSADDDLDLVATSLGVTSTGGLTVAVKVAKLSDSGPANTPGDQFEVSFKAGGTATTATLTRDVLEGTSSASLDGGTAVAGTVVHDVKTSTVTGTFTADQVKKALGKPLAGLKLDTFAALASGYTETPAGPGGAFPQTDSSDAPAALTYTDAGGCTAGAGGGTTSTPAPSATAAPTASATPSPTPGSGPVVGPDGLYDQPRKACVSFTDPAGDADPTTTGANNEASLDVTQVNLKSPATGLQVYVHVADLASGTNLPGEAGSWATSLTIGGKAVVVTVDDAGKATATVAGKATTDLVPTATLDAKHSNVVVTLPKTGLEKVTGAPLKAGTPVTGTAVTTTVVTPISDFPADDAAGTKPAEKTYAYGDNTCFRPAPALLTLDADKTGRYTDRAEVLARLTDSDGAPLKGARVTGQLAGTRAVSALTDADGYADLFLPLTVPAGARTLTVSFAGSTVAGAVSKAVRFGVYAERTLLRATAVRGGVSATLLDDDRHAVAGQLVVFLVGSKKYVLRTSSKGVAALTGLARGTAVKISYAGSQGYFLAAYPISAKAG